MSNHISGGNAELLMVVGLPSNGGSSDPEMDIENMGVDVLDGERNYRRGDGGTMDARFKSELIRGRSWDDDTFHKPCQMLTAPL